MMCANLAVPNAVQTSPIGPISLANRDTLPENSVFHALAFCNFGVPRLRVLGSRVRCHVAESRSIENPRTLPIDN